MQEFDLAQVSITRGLGVMRERVALLGGTLEIESAPGEGTTITADLPYDDMSATSRESLDGAS